MVFPMGGGMPPESPTEFALRMRKWAICLWVLQLLLLIGRFAVLDFMGALSLLLVVVIGYFVPFGKPGMSQRWILCWGLVCVFNAIIDLVLGVVRLIQYIDGVPVGASGGWYGGGSAHHPPHGVDGKKPKPTPMEEYAMKVALLAVVVALLIPLVELLTAWLCYALFQDHKENAADDSESQNGFYGGQTYNDFNYGGAQQAHAGGGGGGGVYNYGNNRGGSGGAPVAQRFRAFEGGGQRLGSAS